MTNDTLTKTIILNADRETVWSFLTDKDKLALWFFSTQANLSEGEDYTLGDIQDDGTMNRMCWGNVQLWEPPSTLVWSFTVEPIKGALTRVTWTLEDIPGGTRLTMVHEGIGAAAGEASFGLLGALDAGWDRHFGKLREAISEG